MPFPAVIPILNTVDNGSNFVTADGTVYGVGPIPLRANLGLKLVMVNNRADGAVFYEPNAYNPLTANSFTFAGIARDGNYTLFYWAVNKKTGIEVPVLNDFVYNSVSGNFERWTGAAWTPATTTDFYTLAQASAYTLNNQHNPDFQKALNYLHRAIADGNATFGRDQLELLAVELGLGIKAIDELFATAPADYQRAVEGYYSTVNLINASIAP